MHWWQNAFSSSSSPSSAKSHSDDILLNRSTRKSDVASFFSFRGGGRSGSGFRSQQRRLTRARKLRHLTDDDLCVSGSPLELPELRRSPSSLEHYSSPRSSCSSASPQPLPLPELAVMLRRDRATALASNHFNANSIPLPSPKEAPNKGREERERADALNGHANGDGVTSNAGFGSRLACQDARRNTEHAERQPYRKSTRELNGAERSQNKHRPNILVSSPVSPFSSPALSPQRNMGDFSPSPYFFPQALQAWSAPEMPPSDMTLGLGSPYQIFSDKAAFSVDNSPLHSPRVSPHQNIRSPNGPPSPPHNKLSIDTSVARRESNAQANIHPLPRESSAQANVHPLPLPPGAAAVPSQAAHSPQVAAKPELIPRKSQWQKGKLIGRGTFGSVYVASNRETGALCAMKEVELLPDDPQSTESIRQLEQEIKVLSKLKHPNIVQYYGSEIVDDRFYIYLEYVHPGSINRYIHDHCGSMTESVVRNFTRYILCGLAYLHSTKTIHRDIKGANLLVDANGVVKLADFGMAKHLTGQAANLSLKGSPYWMAPELLQSVMHPDASPDLALAVDIWSLGCTIIEMMDGKPPWGGLEGPAAMFKVLKETPPIPETMSPEGKDFLRCCFRRNPAERPSASMLLEHRFLKNSQQLDLVSCTQSLNGMKLMDKAHTQRERPGYRLDQLPVSAKEAQSTKRKIANAETGQRSHRETSNLVGVHHHSPRSALDVLPSLSPHSNHNTDHPSPFAVVQSSMKQGAKKNHYFQ